MREFLFCVIGYLFGIFFMCALSISKKSDNLYLRKPDKNKTSCHEVK